MPILTPAMQQALAEQRLIFAATVCPDGTPNLSPKGTAMVWDDDHILFADLASPGTMRNLAVNPSIEINIVSPFSRQGYRFKGTAAIHKDDAIHAAAVARMRAGPLSLQGAGRPGTRRRPGQSGAGPPLGIPRLLERRHRNRNPPPMGSLLERRQHRLAR